MADEGFDEVSSNNEKRSDTTKGNVGVRGRTLSATEPTDINVGGAEAGRNATGAKCENAKLAETTVNVNADVTDRGNAVGLDASEDITVNGRLEINVNTKPRSTK